MKYSKEIQDYIISQFGEYSDVILNPESADIRENVLDEKGNWVLYELQFTLKDLYKTFPEEDFDRPLLVFCTRALKKIPWDTIGIMLICLIDYLSEERILRLKANEKFEEFSIELSKNVENNPFPRR